MCLWIYTQNILPIYWKILILYNVENLKALRFKSSCFSKSLWVSMIYIFCLLIPSHYLNQYWFIIIFLCHSSESNFTRNLIRNLCSKITCLKLLHRRGANGSINTHYTSVWWRIYIYVYIYTAFLLPKETDSYCLISRNTVEILPLESTPLGFVNDYEYTHPFRCGLWFALLKDHFM